MSRYADAELDASIHEMLLRDLGLLEPDEPTPLSHRQYMRALRAEFTPLERQEIRVRLGLWPR